MKKVAVIMGSDSDLPVMKSCLQVLDDFGVPYVKRVLSAHRSPAAAAEFSSRAAANGFGAIIAAAGAAAHLAGAVAAHSTLPVIGVPLAATPLAGFDALLSTVQMPGGVPVATMAVGEAGAKNAALFAVQILALSDENLQAKLAEYKAGQAEAVRRKDEALNRS